MESERNDHVIKCMLDERTMPMFRHVISASLSLSCDCSFAHVPSQLGHTFRQVIVLEQNGRSHIMSSSANDDVTSTYAGSDDICSSDYACNSEDVQSAEIPNGFDHASCASGSDDSVSLAASCQGETPIGTSSKKRRLRMMDEDLNGVRVKIIPCVKQQFRRHMEATKALNDDFYVPNRAQLMLSFLQKHGDCIVQETPGPRKRFPKMLQLVQHALQKSSAGHRQ